VHAESNILLNNLAKMEIDLNERRAYCMEIDLNERRAYCKIALI
jgi:hypothetical protein